MYTASERRRAEEAIPDASSPPAVSVSRPPCLQKICETKIKVTIERVNSSSVAKFGDKDPSAGSCQPGARWKLLIQLTPRLCYTLGHILSSTNC